LLFAPLVHPKLHSYYNANTGPFKKNIVAKIQQAQKHGPTSYDCGLGVHYLVAESVYACARSDLLGHLEDTECRVF
jgi:hypothetical protein